MEVVRTCIYTSCHTNTEVQYSSVKGYLLVSRVRCLFRAGNYRGHVPVRVLRLMVYGVSSTATRVHDTS